jgi:glycine betaine/proline transport system permease protein
MSQAEIHLAPRRPASLGGLGMGWAAVILFALASVLAMPRVPWLADYPAAAELPVADWLNTAMTWVVANFRPVFQAITTLSHRPDGLGPRPPAMAAVERVHADHGRHRLSGAGGWGSRSSPPLGLIYTLLVGLWPQAMNSFALIFLSVPLAVLTGFLLGVWSFSSPRVERMLNPCP